MKKASLRVIKLLFIFMFSFFVGGINKVEAIDGSNEVVSYYQAIMAENGDASKVGGFTAVSQYYMKVRDSEANIINRSQKSNLDKEPSNRLKGYDYYYNLTETSDDVHALCAAFADNGANDAKGLYCDGYELYGSLYSLTISNHGNVVVYLANGVTISSLRFYYIIANQSNDAHLYCDIDKACDNSRVIGEEFSNWKNASKMGGTLSFSSASMKGFVEEGINTGDRRYSGFNIVDNMDTAYANLAKKYGVYVITAASINYQNITYHLNSDITDWEPFMKDVGNYTTAGGSANEGHFGVKVCRSGEDISDSHECQIDTRNSKMISKYAVLVYPHEEEQSEASKNFQYYLEEVIIPVAKVGIILLFLVVGTTTVVTIIKSSDEPEVRHSSIKRLISMFVGSVIIYCLLEFYQEIVDAVKGWFDM